VRRLTANAVRHVCGLRWGQPAVVRLCFDPVSFPAQRITTHLLRLLHPDERRRRILGCHKLHLWWVAAEDDAFAVLLVCHASGFSVQVTKFWQKVQRLSKECKAAAKSTALYTSTAAAAGLGTRTRSGSPQLPRPPHPFPPTCTPQTLSISPHGAGKNIIA
jgi:hypothetical protein